MEATQTQAGGIRTDSGFRRHQRSGRPNRPQRSHIQSGERGPNDVQRQVATPFVIASPDTPTTHEEITVAGESNRPRRNRDRQVRNGDEPGGTHRSDPTRRQGPTRSRSAVRPVQPRVALPNIAKQTTRTPRRTAGRMFHWLTIRLCGYIGGIGLAIGSLVALAAYYRMETLWLYEAGAAVILIRFLLHVASKSSTVLAVHPLPERIQKILVAELYFSTAFLASCFVMHWPLSPRFAAMYLLANGLIQVGFMAFSRPVARRIFSRKDAGRKASYSRTALIVGAGPKGSKVADALLNSPELDTHIVGFLDYRRTGLWRYRDIPLVGHPDQLERLIIAEQIDALFIALDSADISHSDRLFRTAERMGVTVCVLPDMYRPEIAHSSMADLNGLPALVYHTAPHGQVSIMLKGLLDRLGALLAIALSAPIWLAAIAAIKLDSRGPIFFRQIRSGLNGRRFELYKFRTMCIDAEARKAELKNKNEMSGPVFKIRKDPRVTAVGRFLRKYSIDELPQLINILKGDMSLVGPRPPIPDEVSRYQPWQRRKLSVKPGLTCLWQVNGRNAIDFDEWMKLDLEYIDRWSLFLDAKIMARTVPAVLKGSGV